MVRPLAVLMLSLLVAQDYEKRRDELTAKLESVRGLKFKKPLVLREGTRKEYAAYVLENAKRIYGADLPSAEKALKAQFTGDKATRLQIYIDYYGAVDEKTKNFTALPEKTAEKDIVDELNIAARVIRKEFNPDK